MNYNFSSISLIWALALTIALPVSFSANPNPAEVERYFIEPSSILVEEWEGWGTSLAWWADMLGGMNDEVRDHVMDLFFKPEELNLNIVRYVIGGTTPEEVTPYPCGPYRTGAATESYKDGPDEPYNWTRDPRQRLILHEAIERGANILEAFSNSPPQWMTLSGCAKGNPLRFPLHDNFDLEFSRDFAEYIADVIMHFESEWDLTFHYFSPFNEPMGLDGIGSWWGRDSEQEGCNINRTVMAQALRDMDAVFRERGLEHVQTTAADETQINTAINTANFFETEGVDKLIAKWNVHGYWDVPRFYGNRRDALNKIAHKGGQKLWMDEMGWGGTPLDDMTQAFELTTRLLSDLKDMMPSAWVYWQVMEGGGGWGVITVPYRFDATLDEVQINSGFHAFKHFSKYIRQGYQLIYTDDPESVAAFHDESGTLVIVTVHNSPQSSQKAFDIQRFPLPEETSLVISAIRTNATNQGVDISQDSIHWAEGDLILDVTPFSISTLVIRNIHFDKEEDDIISQLENFKNGDFETLNDNSWMTSEDASVNETFPWRGSRMGLIPRPASGVEGFISQKFLVDENVRFETLRLYVTLFGSTVGTGASAEAYVNGAKVSETLFNILQGYRQYGLSFLCNKGDEIEIRIRTEGASGPVFVDNVEIRYAEATTTQEPGTTTMISETTPGPDMTTTTPGPDMTTTTTESETTSTTTEESETPPTTPSEKPPTTPKPETTAEILPTTEVPARTPTTPEPDATNTTPGLRQTTSVGSNMVTFNSWKFGAFIGWLIVTII